MELAQYATNHPNGARSSAHEAGGPEAAYNADELLLIDIPPTIASPKSSPASRYTRTSFVEYIYATISSRPNSTGDTGTRTAITRLPRIA